MKVSKPILGAAFLGLLTLAACKNMDYKKTKDGTLYQVLGEGKGDKIVPGNLIRAHITTRLGDSLLNTTYGGDPQAITIPVGGPNAEMAKFFQDAHKGDSILILQSVDSVLARMAASMAANPMARPDSFLLANKGKSIKTYVKIVEVFKSEAAAKDVLQREAIAGAEKREKESFANFSKDTAIGRQRKQDEAAIEAYLNAKGIKTTRTQWGTYVQTLTPGNGQTPKPGQFISVKYTGRKLNGEVFDSNNKPGAGLLPVQIGAGGVIKGFEDGLKGLSKGQKAVLYIPSVIGYGPNGNGPKIGPNENLIFDIEVADVGDAPAPPPMPSDTASGRK